jgi:hypothetical protein
MKIIKLVAILAIAYFLFFRKEGYNYIELPPTCDKEDPELKCKDKRGRNIKLTETSARDCLTGKDAMVACKDMYTKMYTANSTFKGDKGDKIIKQFMSQVASGSQSTQVAPGSQSTQVAPIVQPITRANDLRKQIEDQVKTEMKNREQSQLPIPQQPTMTQPSTSTRADELRKQIEDKIKAERQDAVFDQDIRQKSTRCKMPLKTKKVGNTTYCMNDFDIWILVPKTITSPSNYIRLSEL